MRRHLQIFKLKQNRTKKDQDKLAQIQNDTNLATDTETADGYNPNSDVELLGGYVLGSNRIYYTDEVNEIVFKLSDIELKKLADTWKSQNGVSLYKSLDAEWDSCGWWFSNCYDSAMSRLSKLGKR